MRLYLLTGAALLVASAAAAQGPVHHGLDPANIDTTCAPCKDFNQFANGGWVAHTARPADQPRWGSFSELGDRNQQILKSVVEQLAARASRTRPPRTPRRRERSIPRRAPTPRFTRKNPSCIVRLTSTSE
ncbi:MAG TPA: hypothetical protein VI160_04775, partial [Gemmatimonadales bacterium]